MKHVSRTIGQSRTWARALCNGLERTWWPSDNLLCHFQRWDNAVRECKGKSRMYVFRRHRQLSHDALEMKRDRALRDLLAVRTCGR